MEQNSNTPTENIGTNLIRQYILTHYQPTKDYLNAAVKLSTVQLYQRVMNMFPDADLTVSALYLFLKDQEFTEVEVRPFQSEWLFDRK